MWLIGRQPEPPPPPPVKNWKYVGETREVFPVEGKEYKATIRVVYSMTEDGQRRVEFVPHCYNDILEKMGADIWSDAIIWQRGGPFPKDFVAEEDTLGAMLNRLVNKKLTGEE